MEDNKQTIYSKLNKIMSANSGIIQPEFDANIKITGSSPEEVQKKYSELKQGKYLSDQFFSIERSHLQQVMHYEAQRLHAFTDYEGMEYYPLIASALDLYMEEATVIGDNGKMLNIYSKSPRVKAILTELFYDTLNINVNLPSWTRSTVKYGDNFLYLLLEKGKGIVLAKQLLNMTVERKEEITSDNKLKIFFKKRDNAQELSRIEVAHFRLLGDDKYLPYGSSILNKIRKYWRMCLHEDTNILTENGLIKIKDIKPNDIVYSYDYETGETIKTRVSRTINNGIRETYKVRSKLGEIILTDDHPILIKNKNGFEYKNIKEINIKSDFLVSPLIDNNNIPTIKMESKNYYVKLNDLGISKVLKISGSGIIKRIKSLELNTTLKNTHAFLRGHYRGIKYNDYLILMDEFDLSLDDIDIFYSNNSSKSLLTKKLEYTIDEDFCKFYGFMLGDGWVNFENNNIGFALGIYDEQNKYYIDLISKLSENKNYIITKREGTLSSSLTLYCNEFSNIIKKLEFNSGFDNKYIPKWVFDLPVKYKLSFIRGLFDADGCDNWYTFSSSNLRLITDLQNLAKQCNLSVGNKIMIDNRKLKGLSLNNENEYFKNVNTSYKLYLNLNKEYKTLKSNKIIEITKFNESNVYDIEIDHKTHNFIAENIVVHNCILAEDAMLSYRILRAGDKRIYGVDVGNMATEDILPYVEEFAKSMKRKAVVNPQNANIDYRFNIMGNDEDLFLPRRNGNTATMVETLEGANNLDKIQDIEYFRDLLFTGLGIPKPFLGYQATAGDGKNVTQLDMRFSKKVNRIQQAMIQELSNMAMIHLYLLGLEDEFDNFELSLSPPSTQADILKIELSQSKVSLYNDMTLPSDNGVAPTSHTYAKMSIFNWSEEEIIKDLERQYMERIVTQEIQNATNSVAKSGIFDDILSKFGLKAGEQAIGDIQTDEDGGDGGMPDLGGGDSDISELSEPDNSKNESLNKLFGNKTKNEIKKDVLVENSKKLRNKSDKIINDILNDENLNKI
jgi:intein/homing endonuclease